MPCLIFGGGVFEYEWTKGGVRCVYKLKDRDKTQAKSYKHQDNVCSFNFLGEVDLHNR